MRQRCACHLGRGERQPRLRPVTRSVQSGYSRPRDRAATRSLSRDRAAWPRDEISLKRGSETAQALAGGRRHVQEGVHSSRRLRDRGTSKSENPGDPVSCSCVARAGRGERAGTGAQRGVRCPPTPSRLFWYLWRHQRSLYQAINAHYAITTITLYGMHAYMCFWPMKGCLSCIFARRSTGNLEQAMDEGAAGSQIGGRTCPSEEFDACQSERWMIDWLAMVFP